MPLISDSRSVVANTTVDNVLAGSQFEFLPYDAMLEFGIVGAGALGAILVDVYSGQDVLMEAGVISILGRNAGLSRGLLANWCRRRRRADQGPTT